MSAPLCIQSIIEYEIIDLYIVTCNKYILSLEVRKKCVANPSLQSKQGNPYSRLYVINKKKSITVCSMYFSHGVVSS